MRQSAIRTRGAATWIPDESRPRSPPPRPSMSKPLDLHVRRAHADDAAGARAEEPRGPFADQRERLVDHQVAVVGAGAHDNAVAGLRDVDARLQWRRVLRPRAPFHGSGRHCLALPRSLRRRLPPRSARGGSWRERPVTLPPGRPPRQHERDAEEQHRSGHRVGRALRIGIHLEVGNSADSRTSAA